MTINKKNILFAHSGGPQYGCGMGSFDLVAFLKEQLSGEYDIHFPIIDRPEAPTYNLWKKLFSSQFKNLEQPLILIGHSLGASVLLKYLSEEKPEVAISALFLVAAPHWGETGWEVEDFALKPGFEKELKHIKNIYFYHSEKDATVSLNHLNFYKSVFPEAMVRILNGADHAFTNGLPYLVSDIKALTPDLGIGNPQEKFVNLF